MKHIGLAAAIALSLIAGCSNKSPHKARAVAPTVTRDVPSILRGTVGSEASLLKSDPVLVSGYGLVVGLNGTGGGDLDERIASTMERQLGLMQVNKSGDLFDGTPLEGMTPRQVLRSREVAVVVVFAAVIPGAPSGATFDVYVRAASNSPDISLEGGTLWTTELQAGPPRPYTGVQTRKLATAHGPIFINPFGDASKQDVPSRRDGRILGGGVVTDPLELELVLDNESHTRARQITEAINNRFRPGPGDEPVARGRSSRLVNVTVPIDYRERSQEFIQTLLHTQIDQTQPQEFARKYVDGLKGQPFLGDELSWCLQALPQRAALPFLREMYDWPEMVPRLAALRAGANLGDPLTAPHLKQLGLEGTAAVRADAIRLLGKLQAGPTVDTTLTEFLKSDNLLVRVAAYEALVDREEKIQMRRWMERQANLPAAVRVSMPQTGPDPRTVLELPGDTIQGVRRKVVGGKFLLDIVPVGDPLIYVSQQGRPRIVLFGESLEVKRPVMVAAWDGDPNTDVPGDIPNLARLMLVAETPTDTLRMLYRYPDRVTDSGDTIVGKTVQAKVKPDLVPLIEFLAHTPGPDDPSGLGLTYSEVVGVLHAIEQKGGIGKTPLAVEDDLLKARLLTAANANAAPERPESAGDVQPVRIYEPAPEAGKAEAAPTPAPAEKPSLVVPLEQPPKKK